MEEDVDALKRRLTQLEDELSLYRRKIVELRVSLTPIRGFVSMLLDDPMEEEFSVEDRLEFYSVIDENVNRLETIIDGLLNLVRIGSIGPNAIEMDWDLVDLHKIIETVVAIQKDRTGNHSFVVDCDPETIIVETDVDKIQNILHNIINNAIKFSPDGGEVRITARTEPPSELYPTGTLLMSIQDQGIGITKHVLEIRGFRDYIITGEKRIPNEGTGKGLYLAANWIRRHDGVMWPASDGEGKGATFWFRIPLRQPKPAGSYE